MYDAYFIACRVKADTYRRRDCALFQSTLSGDIARQTSYNLAECVYFRWPMPRKHWPAYFASFVDIVLQASIFLICCLEAVRNGR